MAAARCFEIFQVHGTGTLDPRNTIVFDCSWAGDFVIFVGQVGKQVEEVHDFR